MINNGHKPCIVDKEKADKIIKTFIQKMNNAKEKYFENLLKRRLGTHEMPAIPLSNIDDFPKLCKKTLYSKLFLGNYYINQAKMYLFDMLKTGWLVNIDVLKKKHISGKLDESILQQLNNELNNSKLIGIQMLSRHCRGLKSKKKHSTKKGCANENAVEENHGDNFRTRYKVFQYKPNLNHSKAIEGLQLRFELNT
jgi:hypothetical protein